MSTTTKSRSESARTAKISHSQKSQAPHMPARVAVAPGEVRVELDDGRCLLGYSKMVYGNVSVILPSAVDPVYLSPVTDEWVRIDIQAGERVVDDADAARGAISPSEMLAKLAEGGFEPEVRDARRRMGERANPPNGLRALRLRAGLSQVELAALANTTQPKISRMETVATDENPTSDMLHRLRDALNCDYNQLMAALGRG